MNQKNRMNIPCKLTESGLSKLKEKIATPLFSTVEGNREDYTFTFNRAKNLVDVMYKGEHIISITNAFWAKIVDVKDPEHYED